MKKLLFLIFAFATVFTACKKEDKNAFEQTPEERLNETLGNYESILTGAANGWLGYLSTDSGRGGTYSFYFKFNNANRVVMLSDFDSLSAVTPKESSYRLKALQQPSLVFDTYSYLHTLSDPDASVNGGAFGAGLISDFEFYFDSTDANRITLVGRFNGSKLVLIKATADQEAALNNGGLAAGLSINKILTYYKRLTIGSQQYDVRIDPVRRLVVFTWVDAGGNLVTFSTGYYLTAGGIIFTNPLVNGSQTISSFDNINYNAGTETISLTSGSAAGTLTPTRLPLKPDLTAPRRWWQFAVDNGQGYWESFSGFHVNGVDDAFNLQSLSGGNYIFYSILYWPAGGPNYDIFAPVFIDLSANSLTILYGSAPQKPTFTTDGRAIFFELGTLGTYPASGPAVRSRELLYSGSGFYFVQTSATTYDMVSAADGKAWITWEY